MIFLPVSVESESVTTPARTTYSLTDPLGGNFGRKVKWTEVGEIGVASTASGGCGTVGRVRSENNRVFRGLLKIFLGGLEHLFSFQLHPQSVLSKDLQQGCQIFLGTKYQNGKKYTKLPRIIPNVHKIK
jgi:hypothetical protein